MKTPLKVALSILLGLSLSWVAVGDAASDKARWRTRLKAGVQRLSRCVFKAQAPASVDGRAMVLWRGKGRRDLGESGTQNGETAHTAAERHATTQRFSTRAAPGKRGHGDPYHFRADKDRALVIRAIAEGMPPDHYAVLEVARDASAREIKAAYRRKAREYHPDTSKRRDTEVMFKLSAEAYAVLKDEKKRATYNAELMGAIFQAEVIDPARRHIPRVGPFQTKAHEATHWWLLRSR